jgi:Toluene-4-monooxygenase system protein B (TmoB)
VIVHLFGHLGGDFVVRVVFIDTDQTIEALANQLQAWGPELYPSPVPGATVRNENGVVLDPAATLAEAGLDAGDLFSVEGLAL